MFALGLSGLVALAAARPSISSLIGADAVQQYRQAADEARHGRSPVALAMLEGLLLERPVTIGFVGRGGRGRYAEGVTQGVDAWSRVLPDSPFRMAPPGERPDITVQFVPRVSGGGRDTQGIVNVRRHYSWNGSTHQYQIFGAIQIRDVAFGRRLTEDEVARVMAHELGHVLGLGDDYDGPGVMSAFRDGGGPMLPSREEVDAVAGFREQLRTVLRRTRDG